MELSFRDLRGEELDVRVGTVTEKGVTLLLYKDARCDMNVLDEAVGPEGWQREHYECKGNLFCRVGIKCGTEWIWKADCGQEMNKDDPKGEASDSFKRACTNWGIGRELYTSPLIWVAADCCTIRPRGNGFDCRDRFEIREFEVTDKKITRVEIYNKTLRSNCYSFPARRATGEAVTGWEIIPPAAKATEKKVSEKKSTETVCQICGKDVKPAVAEFSKRRFDKILCYDCQKEVEL